MHILLLTPQLPYPPQQGTSLRNFYLLKGMAQNHRITLLSFCDDPSADFGPLTSLCEAIFTVPTPEHPTTQRLINLITTRLPDLAHRLDSPSMHILLDQVLQNQSADLIQIEGLELACYLPTIRALCPQVRILFDCHNAETALQETAWRTDLQNPRRWLAALYSRLQIGRLRHFERTTCQSADIVTVVSEQDRQALQQLGLTIPATQIIPNCLDVQEYATPTPHDPSTHFDVVFSGKLDYRPNVDGASWFLQRCWPLVRQTHPQATCALVGQKPHPALQAWHGRDGVTLTGRVDQVQPYLQQARVYIAPLRMGGGTRLKLLEAMAAGVPIVSTRQGAEGFELKDGQDLLLADSADSFAQAILTLWSDSSLCELIVTNGQNFAQQYDWRNVTPRLLKLY